MQINKCLSIENRVFLSVSTTFVAHCSLTYNLQDVCESLISKYFFSERDFCMITPHFFNPVLKLLCNFSLQFNTVNRRNLFLALWVLKAMKKLNWRKTKFTLTCSFRKVIRALGNSFYFKILGII